MKLPLHHHHHQTLTRHPRAGWMLIKVRGPSLDAERTVDVTYSLTLPCTSKLQPHLVKKFGKRLAGKQVMGTMPDGKWKQINLTQSAADYGFGEDTVWSIFVRTPPIPESAIATVPDKVILTDGASTEASSAGNGVVSKTMTWSRKLKRVGSPAEVKKPTSAAGLPKKSYLKKLANSPTPEQAQRSLFHYNFVVNDGLISKDLSRSILSEVVQMHLKGSLSANPSQPGGDTAPPEETYGGISCWVSGDHHNGIRRCMRLVDAMVFSIPGLEVGTRGPALVGCYSAGGTQGRMHADNTNDPRRKLSVTIFLQQRGSGASSAAGNGGEVRMLTPTNEVVIAPLMGRVLVHWSDARCRHEVRPTSSQAHYALTVWYHQREPAVQEGFPTQLSAASLRSDLATPAEDKKAKNRQKKKKKKKKKADAARTPAPTAGVDSDVEDASDSSEDNWMLFCGALRAALTAALAITVAYSPIPPAIDTVEDTQQPASTSSAAPTPAALTATPAKAEETHNDQDDSPVLVSAPNAVVEAQTAVLSSLSCLRSTRRVLDTEGRTLRRLQAAMAAHHNAAEELMQDHLAEVEETVCDFVQNSGCF